MTCGECGGGSGASSASPLDKTDPPARDFRVWSRSVTIQAGAAVRDYIAHTWQSRSLSRPQPVACDNPRDPAHA